METPNGNKVAIQTAVGQALAKEYMVPGAVGVALSTKRPKFIDALIGEVERGAVLPQEQVVGLLRLIQESIEENLKLDSQLRRMNLVQEALEDFTKGLHTKSDQLAELIADAQEGKLTPEFETAEDRKHTKAERAERR